VHIHDGNIHPSTDFDHDLYCQADGLLGATLDWTTSVGPLGAHVEELKARGVVRAASPGFTLAMNGTHPNHDMVLHTSDITFAGDVVSAEGDCWAVRLHGAHARRDPKTVAPDRQAWCETSRHALDRVFAALRDGVPELAVRHGKEWGLAPARESLAPYGEAFPSFWPNRYPPVQRPGTFLFMGEIYTPRVDHQEVVFSFKEAPSRAIERAIETETRRLLDQAFDQSVATT